jgi:saccharopine dehydrogenase-like NADP-dependent oxidoreductase
MKALILGAVGEMCTPATKDLVKRKIFSDLTLADINIEKLMKLAKELKVPKEKVTKLDASDSKAMRKIMKGKEVVVNGLPKPFALEVLKAALELKISSCDLGSPDDRMIALDSKAKDLEVSYVAGMGATPGITNLMARHATDALDEVDEIHVSFAAVRPFALSPALLDTILWEFEPELPTRIYYQNGEFYPVPPFSGERQIEFPYPIGPQKVYFVPHGETRSFPRNLGAKRVYVRGTFTPKGMRLMRSLLEYGFYDENSIQIQDLNISPKELIMQALLQMPEANHKEDLYAYGLNVEVIGRKWTKRVKRTYWTTHPSMAEWGTPYAYSNNVGLPLGICAQMIARGEVQKGVNAPEAMLEPAVFFDELAKRGIRVHYKEESISSLEIPQ